EHPAPWLGYSNRVVFKPSDEANACAWLRYMFAYTKDDLLHLGRAIPRAWFAQTEAFEAQNMATPFGRVGVRYIAAADGHLITANVSLDLRRAPEKILVRFRHATGARIRSVTVNGKPHTAFDDNRSDVDITG